MQRCLVVVVVVATSAQAQLSSPSAVFNLPANGPFDQFGSSVATLNDVDRDGYPDLLIGAPQYTIPGARGYAEIISGRSGVAIHSFVGETANDWFGFSVSAAGDVDKDSVEDVIIGASQFRPAAATSGNGYARVFSGADGSELYTFRGGAPGGSFGQVVSGAGDLDADGHADVVVAAIYGQNPAAQAAGFVRVYSGQDGAELWTAYGTRSGDEYGHALGPFGDVNGDGTPDLLIGVPHAPRVLGRNGPGQADIVSGVDGTVLRTFVGDSNGDHFGSAVACVGDVDLDGTVDAFVGGRSYARVFSGRDGSVIHDLRSSAHYFGAKLSGTGDVDLDGVPDLLVGAAFDTTAGLNAGSASLFSGRDGRLLQVFYGNPGDTLGNAVSGGRDYNLDGVPDLVVGAWRASPGPTLPTAGVVHVFSGTELALTAGKHFVSIAGSGAQVLSLDASTMHANKTYLVLGSLTGTAPGLSVGGVLVALNVDPYFALTAASPNSIIANSFGVLDASGRGTSTFRVPSVLPRSFAGTTLHHAFVVFGTTSLLDLASNAVPVTLVP